MPQLRDILWSEVVMDRFQPDAGTRPAADAVAASSALAVAQATLFVTDTGCTAVELETLLAHTLDRLNVTARQQRVVALMEQPMLARQSLVRVTPCLVLDTGSREVRIPGDLKLLDKALLEAALARH
jgi:hypothetical protein